MVAWSARASATGILHLRPMPHRIFERSIERKKNRGIEAYKGNEGGSSTPSLYGHLGAIYQCIPLKKSNSRKFMTNQNHKNKNQLHIHKSTNKKMHKKRSPNSRASLRGYDFFRRLCVIAPKVRTMCRSGGIGGLVS